MFYLRIVEIFHNYCNVEYSFHLFDVDLTVNVFVLLLSTSRVARVLNLFVFYKINGSHVPLICYKNNHYNAGARTMLTIDPLQIYDTRAPFGKKFR